MKTSKSSCGAILFYIATLIVYLVVDKVAHRAVRQYKHKQRTKAIRSAAATYANMRASDSELSAWMDKQYALLAEGRRIYGLDGKYNEYKSL